MESSAFMGGALDSPLLLHSFNNQARHRYMLLQQPGPRSLMHSYNGMNVFLWGFFLIIVFGLGGGCLLGLLCPCVLSVAFFWYGSFFASFLHSRCPLSPLLWLLHFRWPFETCQECSLSCQPCFLG